MAEPVLLRLNMSFYPASVILFHMGFWQAESVVVCWFVVLSHRHLFSLLLLSHIYINPERLILAPLNVF